MERFIGQCKFSINDHNLMVLVVLITLLAVIFALGMGNVSAAPGDTIYVNGNSTLGNDDWNGESATYQSGIIGPKYSIKNATGTVNTNGQIYIANEQYQGINNTGITIDKNMTINGESQTDTIINGTGANWIFNIQNGIYFSINNLTLTNATTTNGGAIMNDGTLTVTGSTFTGNKATNYGGAIYNHDGTLTVTGSTFINNNAVVGGAIFKNDGTLTVTGSTFTGNNAGSGGAIYNNKDTLTVTCSTFTGNTANSDGGAIYNGGTLTVNNSNFTSNTAQYHGGAIANYEGTVINNSTFTSNNSANSGGAIYNYYGTLTATDSNFTSNTADVGGAIFNYGGTVNVTDSTFTSNFATYYGAIYNEGILTVNNSTFTSNTAQAYGGAIYNAYDSTLNVSFCRIVGNTPYDIYSDGDSCDVDYNWWGSNFVGSDPVTAGRVVGATVSKWLVLTTTSDPNTINTGETSNITADLLHDQDGVYQNPTGGHVPDGIVVNFASDALGTVNPLTSTMINGETSTLFTAGLNPGISTITSTVDAETVNTDVTINSAAPPIVTSTNPVNNAVNVALNKVIQITFDKNIQLGMNPWIELYETVTGNTKTFTTNIVDNILSITPTSLLALGTSYSVILHSNSITDMAGIGLTAPYTTRFTTEAAPVVTSTSPLYNAFNVALNKVIQITFDKAIQLGTNPWIELKTSNSGTIVPYTTNIIGNVLSITPNSLLNAGTKYTVILHSNSITDMQGNGLNTPYTTIFTTTLPPVVTSTSPMNNEVNVAVNKVIQINFSKAIQLGTNSWIELKNQYGQIKPYTTSINGNTLNITANAAFARGTTYTVILHSNSVTSTGGAGLTTPYTTKFTTTTT
ncbi:beta strand repeat-containing protein [Methanobacterium spitsbergense]|uniref:Ig-like domain-containing protein n=1 Tax=Methanobacterium spitsbergense TaxID=2874285 RepID=A0A8T5UTF8_9EURY|nr:Ig-like domain-containing protein [Methanobacterium spitsbergense]